MDEVLALTEKIIEEHRQITPNIRATEQAINDLEAVSKLESAKEGLMPGRLDNQKRHLQNLQDWLENIDKGLKAHFEREEKGLLAAFESQGYRNLASALRILILEHQELKNRIVKSKEDLAELTTETSSREVWEGKAWGMRTYLNRTLNLIEAHAKNEEELFNKLRTDLGV